MNRNEFLVLNKKTIELNQHFNAIMISLTISMLLILAYVTAENNIVSYEVEQDDYSSYHQSKMPELNYYNDYESLRSTSNTVVVYPIFTQSAYEWGGIHDFYAGYCDSCISTSIQDYYKKKFVSSGNGYRILEFLDYDIINDIDVDKNPRILEKYDKVILLHNEFVTRTEFDAITKHPKVIYLYPHALSSEIKANYNKNTITLLRGPSYPTDEIVNGFDWVFDNSKYFDDWSCHDWKFYEINNGFMLNCYPETILPNFGHDILKRIKNL